MSGSSCPVIPPILLLKETEGERYLPILLIGAVEAAAIAFEQQGVRPARPMTSTTCCARWSARSAPWRP